MLRLEDETFCRHEIELLRNGRVQVGFRPPPLSKACPSRVDERVGSPLVSCHTSTRLKTAQNRPLVSLLSVMVSSSSPALASVRSVPFLSPSMSSQVVYLSVDVAPPPPPKDLTPSPSLNPPPSMFYSRPFFSRSATSLSPSLSPESIGPATPSSPYPFMPAACLEFGKRSNGALGNGNGWTPAASPAPSASGSSFRSISRGGRDYLPSPSMDGSTDSGGSSCPNANLGIYKLNGASASSSAVSQATTSSVKRKKSVFKLANLAKRNRSKKDLSDTASASSASRTASFSEHEAAPGRTEGDEGITLPWNFQVGMSSVWNNHPILLCILHSITSTSTKGEC